MFTLFSVGHGKAFLFQELVKLGVTCLAHPYARTGHTRDETDLLIKRFTTIKPDIFFFMKDEQLTRSILYRMKKISPKTRMIMWYGDQRGYLIPDLLRQRRGLLSGVLLTNADQKQKKQYNKFGFGNVFPFYHSFSPREFYLKSKKEVPIQHSVFFGGNNFKATKFPLSKMRSKLITAIKDNFDLVVHGNGWLFNTKKFVLRPEFAKVLCTANINIGINHFDIVRYYNRRLFECCASGKLHITYYVPQMEKDFVNHKNIVWFRSIEDCINQIHFYLKHPDKRDRIAKQARTGMLKYHAWDTRAIQFVKIVSKIFNKKFI